MGFLDFIIIYLALGAPFGVYQITLGDRFVSAREFLLGLAAFALWPVTAYLLVRNRISRSFNRKFHRERIIDRERVNLERLLSKSDLSISIVFEFREIFTRFFGLVATELEFTDLRLHPNEIYAATGHPNQQLAAAIVARRNLDRIRRHTVCVLGELSDFLNDRLTAGQRIELAERLVDLEEYYDECAVIGRLRNAIIASPPTASEKHAHGQLTGPHPAPAATH